jgi:membrane associated rhomboid family serine protease
MQRKFEILVRVRSRFAGLYQHCRRLCGRAAQALASLDFITQWCLITVPLLFVGDAFLSRWCTARLPASSQKLLPKFVGLFLSLFSHADFRHWLDNATLLFIFGAFLQKYLRTRDLWAAYVLCGFGAHVAFFAERPLASYLGASGALFGLASIGAVRAHPLLLVLFSARVALEIGFVGTASNIAHSAHVGGALTGLILLVTGLVKSDHSASRQ